MTAEQIETARLLKAHPKCPAGLVQYVVSEGANALACSECRRPLGAEWCPCGASFEKVTLLDCADTVPDLTSDANGGVLLGAIGPHCGFEGSDDGARLWSVEAMHTDELAHAAALAFLVAHP